MYLSASVRRLQLLAHGETFVCANFFKASAKQIAVILQPETETKLMAIEDDRTMTKRRAVG